MVYFALTPRCFANRHAATSFYQLQRGFGGRRQHARLAPSRNTALGSGSFCNSAFFSPKYPLRQRSESNNIGDWLIQSKKDGKDQESIQSSTTPDPGYQWESNKLTVRHHRRELRSQDNLQIYYSSASATVLSEPR